MSVALVESAELEAPVDAIDPSTTEPSDSSEVPETLDGEMSAFNVDLGLDQTSDSEAERVVEDNLLGISLSAKVRTICDIQTTSRTYS